MAARLDCEVQEYEWGHPTWIPHLLGEPERSGRPNAELWMGAHQKAPSRIGGVGLDELIAANPEAMLGEATSEAFAGLPYLFKVLAIDRPLSIQSHPSLIQARTGFARENKLGIALDASDRTYRDDNHKPEMICAVVDFEGLCGFRSVADALAMLDAVQTSALDPVRSLLTGPGTPAELMAASVGYLLRLERDKVGALVDEVSAGLRKAQSSSDTGHAEAATALLHAADDYPGDIGVVVGLLLNHVKLEPGDALFLGAGNLHAYLSGVGVELMANSDNVIRGGLTPKHIDIDELLAVVDCSPLDVPIESPKAAVHSFSSPVEEFSLTRVDLSKGGSSTVGGPAIVLLTEGQAEVPGLGLVKKGEPVFVAASDQPIELAGSGLAWVASVSDEQITL